MNDLSLEDNRDLTILEHLERDPDATQANLAAQLGVAVGTINWHLKRLIEKGYIKARRVERRKLRYIITPDGLAMRANMTLDYIQNSFRMYRLVRQRMVDALAELRAAGFDRVTLDGNGDVAEVCRLTCLEQGVAVVDDPTAPRIVIKDLKLFVELGAGGEHTAHP